MKWEFSNDQPIYTQLMQRLSEMIISGEYAPGEKLPSVREFAMQAGVNPNTMQRALTDLEREELVYSQRTAGRFVTEDRTRIGQAKQQQAEKRTRQYLQSMKSIGCTAADAAEYLRCIRTETEGTNEDTGMQISDQEIR